MSVNGSKTLIVTQSFIAMTITNGATIQAFVPYQFTKIFKENKIKARTVAFIEFTYS